MFTRCLCRYAVESPPVSTSLLEVADQTSSVPIARISAVAPNSVQSRLGTATRVRLTASRLIGATLIRGARKTEAGVFVEALIGSPSRQAGGSTRHARTSAACAEAWCPSIAAREGFTFMPLMP